MVNPGTQDNSHPDHRCRCISAAAVLPVCFLFLFISCATTASVPRETVQNDYGIVTGSVIWPGTYPYTQGNVVVDISLRYIPGDGQPVQEIAHQRIRSPQRFPVNFTLRYDRADIKSNGRYSIQAAVSRTTTEEPFLSSSENTWVITGGRPARDIALLLTE